MRRRPAIPAVLAVLGILGVFALAAALDGAAIGRADLVIANGQEPQSLDPARATAIPESRVLSCLFEGLVVPHPETLELRPGTAASWSVSGDGKRWTFAIRPGLRWSDGHPLDAEDLLWSFRRVLRPETAAAAASLLDAVEGAGRFRRGLERDPAALGISAQGAHTLVFALERPEPAFLQIVGLFPFHPVPRHVVEVHGADWVRARPFVGNGPFRLVRRRVRDRIRVERNPHYWDAANVALRTIDLLAVDSATTQLNLYVTGAADWITDVPRSAVPELLARYGPGATGELRPTLQLATYYYRLNVRRPPLDHPKVRQALALAIDREAIVREVTRAGEVAARSFVPPGIRGYAPPEVAAFDPSRARLLLEEARAERGAAAFPPIEVLFNTSAEHQAVAEVIQASWQAILGLTVRLANQDWGSFQSSVRTGDYQVARASWFGDYDDPASFLDLYLSGGTNNLTGFADAEYDRLVGAVARAAVPAAERAAALADAERRLLEAAAIVPIYHYVTTSMVKPYVLGFHPNVMDLHPVKDLALRR